MGIRSEVAVAVKNNVLEAMSQEQIARWFGDCDEVLEHKEGKLFHWEGVKWYRGLDSDVDSLYEFLGQDGRENDYLVVEACHDYPESEDGNAGSWVDNPWDIYKFHTVGVHIS